MTWQLEVYKDQEFRSPEFMGTGGQRDLPVIPVLEEGRVREYPKQAAYQD